MLDVCNEVVKTSTELVGRIGPVVEGCIILEASPIWMRHEVLRRANKGARLGKEHSTDSGGSHRLGNLATGALSLLRDALRYAAKNYLILSLSVYCMQSMLSRTSL